MWDCLERTQELCDAFHTVPVESYAYLTFAPILHPALAVIKALRLLCVEDDAWVVDTARTIYIVPDALGQLIKPFKTASSLHSL